MKKSFLFIMTLIFNLVLTYGQSEWRADLRVDGEYYIQFTEINVGIVCDLYFDDVLVSPQANYRFDWYRSLPNSDPTWVYRLTVYGSGEYGTHAIQDSNDIYGKLDFYCTVTIPGEDPINSDIIRVPWYSVSPNQKKSSGSSFGSIDYWYKGNFRDNDGLNEIYIPRYDSKVLQAETNVVFSPQEKYRHWEGNQQNTYYNNFSQT